MNKLFNLFLKGSFMNLSILIIALFNNSLNWSQSFDDICITTDIPTSKPYYTGSTDPQYLENMGIIVFNIYFWRIDGPSGVPAPGALTEEIALESVQKLNIEFNPIGIYFKYLGMEAIQSPSNVVQKVYDYSIGDCVTLPDPDPDGYETIDICQVTSWQIWINNNGYYLNNAINCYIPKGLTSFGGGALGHRRLITSPNGAVSPIMVHEVGHIFDLLHPFESWVPEDVQNPDPEFDCEHVTRDPNNSSFNADQEGDLIIDTAAAPDFIFEYCDLDASIPRSDCLSTGPYNYFYYRTNECKYIGAESPYFRTDCEGTIYQISLEDSRNHMSYAPSECRDNFTIGQGIAMREFIEANSYMNEMTTTVAALYEPYKGEYYFAGPSNPSNPPLFQPGFDYRFVECCCNYPEPSDYEDTSFSYYPNSVLKTIYKNENDFSKITHPNHSAIRINIPQLDSDQLTRKCYDNYNRAAEDGSITTFLDGVLNTNVMVQTKDSIEINDLNLINSLPTGLYKIEKNYNDGTIEQNVILKQGNN